MPQSSGNGRPRLSKFFCWTKFGVESGETPVAIFRRKELERAANDGVFLWGIGNSVGESVIKLAQLTRRPKLVFTPMVSRARAADERPGELCVWTSAKTATGKTFHLPEGSLVTSRWTSRPHYALVCSSLGPLEPQLDGPRFSHSQCRNLFSGKRLGFSQVTSVVSFDHDVIPADNEMKYQATLICELVEPYVVRLMDPIVVRNDEELSGALRQGNGYEYLRSRIAQMQGASARQLALEF